MLMRCYSIFDNKALQYHPPFYATTDGAAVRSLRDAVADPQTSLSRHPSDYALYFTGTFDDQKGTIEQVFPLVHIVDAVALVPAVAMPLFKKEA